MDAEMISFMKFLSDKSYVTLAAVEKSIHITRRQTVYRLEKINDLLKKNGQSPLVITAAKEIPISEKTKAVIKKEIGTFYDTREYYLSRKERIIYIYMMLFAHSGYLTMDHFMDELKVSRTTIFLDLKELSRRLENKKIDLKNNRKKGYYLEGSEMDIRSIMMRYVIFTLAENQSSKVFDMMIHSYHLTTFAYSKSVIEKLAEKYNIHFVEDRLMEFIYIFIFMNSRMHYQSISESDMPKLVEMMAAFKEYRFALELIKNFNKSIKIAQNDIYYIASWILGISFGDIKENTRDCLLISDIVGEIMTRYEALSGSRYENTETIFIQLYAHFRPAYYRLIFKLPIFNPLCRRIQSEYKELYCLVEETMKPFQLIFGGEIPSDELAYLTIHFATIYSQKKTVPLKNDELKTKVQNALIVCSNGIGSSIILYNELSEMFPELHFFEPIEISQFSDFKKEIRIIFTTSYVSLSELNQVPVVRVKPVMSTDERYQVLKEVNIKLGNIYSRQMDINSLLKIIEKHAAISDRDQLSNDLLWYLSKNYHRSIQNEQNLHLLDMIHKDLIRLQVKADNWEEALRFSYEPLVKNGIVSQNYVEKTVNSVQLMGPYIVIAKHVALPHAKKEEGALQNGLGITVLKEPVVFGDKYNDPVKYIFCLSAVNNHAHIAAMSELVELLNDASFYQFLDQVQDVEEMVAYLEHKEYTQKQNIFL